MEGFYMSTIECNEPLAIDERAQQERFEAHRARFKERRARAGFTRWKMSVHCRQEYLARLNKPPQPPVTLPKRD
jgi:hypothetical protein